MFDLHHDESRDLDRFVKLVTGMDRPTANEAQLWLAGEQRRALAARVRDVAEGARDVAKELSSPGVMMGEGGASAASAVSGVAAVLEATADGLEEYGWHISEHGSRVQQMRVAAYVMGTFLAVQFAMLSWTFAVFVVSGNFAAAWATVLAWQRLVDAVQLSWKHFVAQVLSSMGKTALFLSVPMVGLDGITQQIQKKLGHRREIDHEALLHTFVSSAVFGGLLGSMAPLRRLLPQWRNAIQRGATDLTFNFTTGMASGGLTLEVMRKLTPGMMLTADDVWGSLISGGLGNMAGLPKAIPEVLGKAVPDVVADAFRWADGQFQARVVDGLTSVERGIAKVLSGSPESAKPATPGDLATGDAASVSDSDTTAVDTSSKSTVAKSIADTATVASGSIDAEVAKALDDMGTSSQLDAPAVRRLADSLAERIAATENGAHVLDRATHDGFVSEHARLEERLVRFESFVAGELRTFDAQVAGAQPEVVALERQALEHQLRVEMGDTPTQVARLERLVQQAGEQIFQQQHLNDVSSRLDGLRDQVHQRLQDLPGRQPELAADVARRITEVSSRLPSQPVESRPVTELVRTLDDLNTTRLVRTDSGSRDLVARTADAAHAVAAAEARLWPKGAPPELQAELGRLATQVGDLRQSDGVGPHPEGFFVHQADQVVRALERTVEWERVRAEVDAKHAEQLRREALGQEDAVEVGERIDRELGRKLFDLVERGVELTDAEQLAVVEETLGRRWHQTQRPDGAEQWRHTLSDELDTVISRHVGLDDLAARFNRAVSAWDSSRADLFGPDRPVDNSWIAERGGERFVRDVLAEWRQQHAVLPDGPEPLRQGREWNDLVDRHLATLPDKVAELEQQHVFNTARDAAFDEAWRQHLLRNGDVVGSAAVRAATDLLRFTTDVQPRLAELRKDALRLADTPRGPDGPPPGDGLRESLRRLRVAEGELSTALEHRIDPELGPVLDRLDAQIRASEHVRVDWSELAERLARIESYHAREQAVLTQALDGVRSGGPEAELFGFLADKVRITDDGRAFFHDPQANGLDYVEHLAREVFHDRLIADPTPAAPEKLGPHVARLDELFHRVAERERWVASVLPDLPGSLSPEQLLRVQTNLQQELRDIYHRSIDDLRSPEPGVPADMGWRLVRAVDALAEVRDGTRSDVDPVVDEFRTSVRIAVDPDLRHASPPMPDVVDRLLPNLSRIAHDLGQLDPSADVRFYLQGRAGNFDLPQWVRGEFGTPSGTPEAHAAHQVRLLQERLQHRVELELRLTDELRQAGGRFSDMVPEGLDEATVRWIADQHRADIARALTGIERSPLLRDVERWLDWERDAAPFASAEDVYTTGRDAHGAEERHHRPPSEQLLEVLRQGGASEALAASARSLADRNFLAAERAVRETLPRQDIDVPTGDLRTAYVTRFAESAVPVEDVAAAVRNVQVRAQLDSDLREALGERFAHAVASALPPVDAMPDLFRRDFADELVRWRQREVWPLSDELLAVVREQFLGHAQHLLRFYDRVAEFQERYDALRGNLVGALNFAMVGGFSAGLGVPRTDFDNVLASRPDQADALWPRFASEVSVRVVAPFVLDPATDVLALHETYRNILADLPSWSSDRPAGGAAPSPDSHSFVDVARARFATAVEQLLDQSAPNFPIRFGELVERLRTATEVAGAAEPRFEEAFARSRAQAALAPADAELLRAHLVRELHDIVAEGIDSGAWSEFSAYFSRWLSDLPARLEAGPELDTTRSDHWEPVGPKLAVPEALLAARDPSAIYAHVRPTLRKAFEDVVVGLLSSAEQEDRADELKMMRRTFKDSVQLAIDKWSRANDEPFALHRTYADLLDGIRGHLADAEVLTIARDHAEYVAAIAGHTRLNPAQEAHALRSGAGRAVKELHRSGAPVELQLSVWSAVQRMLDAESALSEAKVTSDEGLQRLFLSMHDLLLQEKDEDAALVKVAILLNRPAEEAVAEGERAVRYLEVQLKHVQSLPTSEPWLIDWFTRRRDQAVADRALLNHLTSQDRRDATARMVVNLPLDAFLYGLMKARKVVMLAPEPPDTFVPQSPTGQPFVDPAQTLIRELTRAHSRSDADPARPVRVIRATLSALQAPTMVHKVLRAGSIDVLSNAVRLRRHRMAEIENRLATANPVPLEGLLRRERQVLQGQAAVLEAAIRKHPGHQFSDSDLDRAPALIKWLYDAQTAVDAALESWSEESSPEDLATSLQVVWNRIERESRARPLSGRDGVLARSDRVEQLDRVLEERYREATGHLWDSPKTAQWRNLWRSQTAVLARERQLWAGQLAKPVPGDEWLPHHGKPSGLDVRLARLLRADHDVARATLDNDLLARQDKVHGVRESADVESREESSYWLRTIRAMRHDFEELARQRDWSTQNIVVVTRLVAEHRRTRLAETLAASVPAEVLPGETWATPLTNRVPPDLLNGDVETLKHYLEGLVRTDFLDPEPVLNALGRRLAEHRLSGINQWYLETARAYSEDGDVLDEVADETRSRSIDVPEAMADSHSASDELATLATRNAGPPRPGLLADGVPDYFQGAPEQLALAARVTRMLMESVLATGGMDLIAIQEPLAGHEPDVRDEVLRIAVEVIARRPEIALGVSGIVVGADGRSVGVPAKALKYFRMDEKMERNGRTVVTSVMLPVLDVAGTSTLEALIEESVLRTLARDGTLYDDDDVTTVVRATLYVQILAQGHIRWFDHGFSRVVPEPPPSRVVPNTMMKFTKPGSRVVLIGRTRFPRPGVTVFAAVDEYLRRAARAANLLRIASSEEVSFVVTVDIRWRAPSGTEEEDQAPLVKAAEVVRTQVVTYVHDVAPTYFGPVRVQVAAGVVDRLTGRALVPASWGISAPRLTMKFHESSRIPAVEPEFWHFVTESRTSRQAGYPLGDAVRSRMNHIDKNEAISAVQGFARADLLAATSNVRLDPDTRSKLLREFSTTAAAIFVGDLAAKADSRFDQSYWTLVFALEQRLAGGPEQREFERMVDDVFNGEPPGFVWRFLSGTPARSSDWLKLLTTLDELHWDELVTEPFERARAEHGAGLSEGVTKELGTRLESRAVHVLRTHLSSAGRLTRKFPSALNKLMADLPHWFAEAQAEQAEQPPGLPALKELADWTATVGKPFDDAVTNVLAAGNMTSDLVIMDVRGAFVNAAVSLLLEMSATTGVTRGSFTERMKRAVEGLPAQLAKAPRLSTLVEDYDRRLREDFLALRVNPRRTREELERKLSSARASLRAAADPVTVVDRKRVEAFYADLVNRLRDDLVYPEHSPWADRRHTEHVERWVPTGQAGPWRTGEPARRTPGEQLGEFLRERIPERFEPDDLDFSRQDQIRVSRDPNDPFVARRVESSEDARDLLQRAGQFIARLSPFLAADARFFVHVRVEHRSPALPAAAQRASDLAAAVEWMLTDQDGLLQGHFPAERLVPARVRVELLLTVHDSPPSTVVSVRPADGVQMPAMFEELLPHLGAARSSYHERMLPAEWYEAGRTAVRLYARTDAYAMAREARLARPLRAELVRMFEDGAHAAFDRFPTGDGTHFFVLYGELRKTLAEWLGLYQDAMSWPRLTGRLSDPDLPTRPLWEDVRSVLAADFERVLHGVGRWGDDMAGTLYKSLEARVWDALVRNGAGTRLDELYDQHLHDVEVMLTAFATGQSIWDAVDGADAGRASQLMWAYAVVEGAIVLRGATVPPARMADLHLQFLHDVLSDIPEVMGVRGVVGARWRVRFSDRVQQLYETVRREMEQPPSPRDSQVDQTQETLVRETLHLISRIMVPTPDTGNMRFWRMIAATVDSYSTSALRDVVTRLPKQLSEHAIETRGVDWTAVRALFDGQVDQWRAENGGQLEQTAVGQAWENLVGQVAMLNRLSWQGVVHAVDTGVPLLAEFRATPGVVTTRSVSDAESGTSLGNVSLPSSGIFTDVQLVAGHPIDLRFNLWFLLRRDIAYMARRMRWPVAWNDDLPADVEQVQVRLFDRLAEMVAAFPRGDFAEQLDSAYRTILVEAQQQLRVLSFARFRTVEVDWRPHSLGIPPDGWRLGDTGVLDVVRSGLYESLWPVAEALFRRGNGRWLEQYRTHVSDVLNRWLIDGSDGARIDDELAAVLPGLPLHERVAGPSGRRQGPVETTLRVRQLLRHDVLALSGAEADTVPLVVTELVDELYARLGEELRAAFDPVHGLGERYDQGYAALLREATERIAEIQETAVDSGFPRSTVDDRTLETLILALAPLRARYMSAVDSSRTPHQLAYERWTNLALRAIRRVTGSNGVRPANIDLHLHAVFAQVTPDLHHFGRWDPLPTAAPVAAVARVPQHQNVLEEVEQAFASLAEDRGWRRNSDGWFDGVVGAIWSNFERHATAALLAAETPAYQWLVHETAVLLPEPEPIPAMNARVAERADFRDVVGLLHARLTELIAQGARTPEFWRERWDRISREAAHEFTPPVSDVPERVTWLLRQLEASMPDNAWTPEHRHPASDVFTVWFRALAARRGHRSDDPHDGERLEEFRRRLDRRMRADISPQTAFELTAGEAARALRESAVPGTRYEIDISNLVAELRNEPRLVGQTTAAHDPGTSGERSGDSRPWHAPMPRLVSASPDTEYHYAQPPGWRPADVVLDVVDGHIVVPAPAREAFEELRDALPVDSVLLIETDADLRDRVRVAVEGVIGVRQWRMEPLRGARVGESNVRVVVSFAEGAAGPGAHGRTAAVVAVLSGLLARAGRDFDSRHGADQGDPRDRLKQAAMFLRAVLELRNSAEFNDRYEQLLRNLPRVEPVLPVSLALPLPGLEVATTDVQVRSDPWGEFVYGAVPSDGDGADEESDPAEGHDVDPEAAWLQWEGKFLTRLHAVLDEVAPGWELEFWQGQNGWQPFVNVLRRRFDEVWSPTSQRTHTQMTQASRRLVRDFDQYANLLERGRRLDQERAQYRRDGDEPDYVDELVRWHLENDGQDRTVGVVAQTATHQSTAVAARTWHVGRPDEVRADMAWLSSLWESFPFDDDFRGVVGDRVLSPADRVRIEREFIAAVLDVFVDAHDSHGRLQAAEAVVAYQQVLTDVARKVNRGPADGERSPMWSTTGPITTAQVPFQRGQHDLSDQSTRAAIEGFLADVGHITRQVAGLLRSPSFEIRVAGTGRAGHAWPLGHPPGQTRTDNLVEHLREAIVLMGREGTLPPGEYTVHSSRPTPLFSPAPTGEERYRGVLALHLARDAILLGGPERFAQALRHAQFARLLDGGHFRRTHEVTLRLRGDQPVLLDEGWQLLRRALAPVVDRLSTGAQIMIGITAVAMPGEAGEREGRNAARRLRGVVRDDLAELLSMIGRSDLVGETPVAISNPANPVGRTTDTFRMAIEFVPRPDPVAALDLRARADVVRGLGEYRHYTGRKMSNSAAQVLETAFVRAAEHLENDSAGLASSEVVALYEQDLLPQLENVLDDLAASGESPGLDAFTFARWLPTRDTATYPSLTPEVLAWLDDVRPEVVAENERRARRGLVPVAIGIRAHGETDVAPGLLDDVAGQVRRALVRMGAGESVPVTVRQDVGAAEYAASQAFVGSPPVAVVFVHFDSEQLGDETDS